jgi:hypothetical protein
VSSVHYTDHQDGVRNERHDSYLHKFSPGGAWEFWTTFPEQFSDLPSVKNRGATTAPPNIWRWNSTEAIIVPVLYRGSGDGTNPRFADLRLIAFSTTGTVLANQLVTQAEPPPDITAGCNGLFCDIWHGVLDFFDDCSVNGLFVGEGRRFESDQEPYLALADAGFPLPGVAIRPDLQGGPPFVMVTDARHDKIPYSFSPQSGFSEGNRSHQVRRQFTTSPVVLPNGDTLTGTLDGYLTRTSATNFLESINGSGLGALTAAPTRLSDGGLVVVSREGSMTVIRGHRTQIQLAGESIASAAASCNHIFVATTNDFETFDRKTLAQVASVPWVGGGLHSPVIGPDGQVYAIASNVLFVFPPPWRPFPGMPPSPSCFLLPPVLTQ